MCSYVYVNENFIKSLTSQQKCLTISYRTYVLYDIREDVYLTSSEYRNDPMFLRNHFNGDGTFEMPKKKEDIDLEKIELIGYDKIAGSSADQIVHFFEDY